MKDNRGITLIELIVVIGLMASIIAAIAAFYVSGVKGYNREVSTADNQYRVRRASNDIEREIRRASNITVNSGKLELEYSDGTKNVYKLEDKVLKIDHYSKDETGAYIYSYTSELAQGIRTFDIVMNSDEITMTIESSENSEGVTYKLTTELSIRK